MRLKCPWPKRALRSSHNHGRRWPVLLPSTAGSGSRWTVPVCRVPEIRHFARQSIALRNMAPSPNPTIAAPTVATRSPATRRRGRCSMKMTPTAATAVCAARQAAPALHMCPSPSASSGWKTCGSMEFPQRMLSLPGTTCTGTKANPSSSTPRTRTVRTIQSGTDCHLISFVCRSRSCAAGRCGPRGAGRHKLLGFPPQRARIGNKSAMTSADSLRCFRVSTFARCGHSDPKTASDQPVRARSSRKGLTWGDVGQFVG